MISNRELKGQMDQLAEQNQYLTEELEQIKELLKQQAGGNQGNRSSNQNAQTSQSGGNSQGGGSCGGSNGSADTGGGSNGGGSGSSSGGGSSGGSRGSGSSGGSGGSGGSNGSGISDMAQEFCKLKDLTSQLEDKMSNYIAQQSSGKPLSDEDAINLILTMMNGMIDWSMDLLSRSSGSSNQQQ